MISCTAILRYLLRPTMWTRDSYGIYFSGKSRGTSLWHTNLALGISAYIFAVYVRRFWRHLPDSLLQYEYIVVLRFLVVITVVFTEVLTAVPTAILTATTIFYGIYLWNHGKFFGNSYIYGVCHWNDEGTYSFLRELSRKFLYNSFCGNSSLQVVRACLNLCRPGWNGWNGTRLLEVVRSIPSCLCPFWIPGNRAPDPNRK